MYVKRKEEIVLSNYPYSFLFCPFYHIHVSLILMLKRQTDINFILLYKLKYQLSIQVNYETLQHFLITNYCYKATLSHKSHSNHIREGFNSLSKVKENHVPPMLP